VDGTSIGTDTTAPYEASWDTTAYSDGPHTAYATATDTVSQTATSTVISVNVQNGAATAVHVGDLDGVTSTNHNRWNATVTITVHDASHNPVANITVSGTWSDGNVLSDSCPTNASGQCSMTSGDINTKKATSVTFTVTSLSGSGFTYDSSANHDPDGDSNGATITINLQ
jgi:hypothetical protein